MPLVKKFSRFNSKSLISKLVNKSVNQMEAVAIAKVIEKRFPTPTVKNHDAPTQRVA